MSISCCRNDEISPTGHCPLSEHLSSNTLHLQAGTWWGGLQDSVGMFSGGGLIINKYRSLLERLAWHASHLRRPFTVKGEQFAHEPKISMAIWACSSPRARQAHLMWIFAQNFVPTAGYVWRGTENCISWCANTEKHSIGNSD